MPKPRWISDYFESMHGSRTELLAEGILFEAVANIVNNFKGSPDGVKLLRFSSTIRFSVRLRPDGSHMGYLIFSILN